MGNVLGKLAAVASNHTFPNQGNITTSDDVAFMLIRLGLAVTGHELDGSCIWIQHQLHYSAPVFHCIEEPLC